MSSFFVSASKSSGSTQLSAAPTRQGGRARTVARARHVLCSGLVPLF
jgi:hypothetical protein